MIALRSISTLVLLIFLTLPCTGCARHDCSFASPVTGAAAISDGLGVNIDFTDPRPGEMKMLSDAGLRWVRMDLKWDSTEPAPGRYDFAAYDRLLTALDQFHLRALFILDYSNPFYDNGQPPRTPAARLAFAHWAVSAAKHFAGRGVTWEIWNEPNIAQFWPPRPSVKDYVALAVEVGRAFRAAAPGEKLIGPATSGIDFDFLEACFQAGLLEYWSAVSVHPYRRTDPETVAGDYCRLRRLMDSYAPVAASVGERAGARKEIPIISGEWGYSSVWNGSDDQRQGQLLARSWLTNAAHNISVSIWYDWHDDGTDPREPEHHFGTVYNQYHADRDPVFDPKPAYLAARTLTTFFSGYRFERRLAVGGDDDYVMTFSKGGQTRIAAWTTAGSRHSVLLPLESGSYKSVTHTGQQANVTANQKGLVLTLTPAPLYISRLD